MNYFVCFFEIIFGCWIRRFTFAIIDPSKHIPYLVKINFKILLIQRNYFGSLQSIYIYIYIYTVKTHLEGMVFFMQVLNLSTKNIYEISRLL